MLPKTMAIASGYQSLRFMPGVQGQKIGGIIAIMRFAEFML